MSALNKYKLNGNDMYTAYGWANLRRPDELLQFPKRKEITSFNWREQNGSQYDLTNPTFDDRPVTLSGWMIARSELDFNAKREALFSAFAQQGTLALEVVELGKTFNVFYLDCTKADRITPIKNSKLIAVQMDIVLQVTGFATSFVPLPGTQQVNIVNQNGVVIDQVTAPATYNVIQFKGIKDSGEGPYINSIIDK